MIFLMSCASIAAFIIIMMREHNYKAYIKQKAIESYILDGRKAGPYKPDISVVILNFGRPKNVEKQVNKLGSHPKISEIIVGHGNPDTYQAYKHSGAVIRNIKDYDNNKKYYALRRFPLALKASNNIILMLDDDYIPTLQYIDAIYNQYHRDPDNFCGYYSRLCNKDGYKTSYPCTGIDKHDTNIILTGVSMMGKHLIQRIWREIEKSPYLDEVTVINKGNGDDLIFNYYFQKLYNKNPVLITGKVKHLDNSDGYSAQLEHYDIRTNLCKRFNMTGKNKIVNT
jgi:hypothetical protein